MRDKITKDNWRERLAKNKKDREADCAVSPTGEWYNVGGRYHQSFIEAVAFDMYPKEAAKVKKAKGYGVDYDNILLEHGWIWVSDDLGTGTLVHHRKMNEIQRDVLGESFGFDRPLFRGWTINAMYDEARSV